MKTNPNSITSKLPGVGTSIFATMSQLANEHQAINLSQGFPDFEISKELIGLVNKYMKAGHNQYAPMPGLLSLREAIAEKIFRAYSAQYKPDKEITITAGATQALYTAITAFVREGDEVIVFEPAYDSYVPAIKLNGGHAICFELTPPDYKIDWQSVKKIINNRTRMIIINSPHNPTGTILNAQDLIQLEKLTHNTDIIVLSDEVYEHIIFDNYEHQSVCRYPGLAERSLVVNSFGKTFHATGWKMGYCSAPESLMNEFRKVHQFIVFACNTPIQHAIAEYLKNENNYLEIDKFYQLKRDFFVNALKNSRFRMLNSSGTYFQLLGFNKITDESETAFAIRLTKEHKVASIPVSVFYHKNLDHKVLRFCFAKSEKTLEKAAEILCRI
jgi:methionine aminotransferase